MLQARIRLGVVAALLAVAASSGSVWAQATGNLSVTARAGVGIPGGDLRFIQDPGLHTGGSIAFYFTPNIAIRGEVTASFLKSIEDSFGNIPSPDMDLIHFGGGFELNFSRSRWQTFPITVVASLGAGATNVKAAESFSDGSSVDFSSTVFTANGGAEIGWQFTDNVNVFGSFQAYAMFFDEEETVVFADRSPEIEPFDLAWEFPVSLGVRISVQ